MISNVPDDQKPLPIPFGVADAVFLAFVTAATYLAAYQFEAGYCGYFSIPLEVIKLSVEALLVAFLGVSGFITSFFYFCDALLRILPQRFWEKGNRWRYLIFFNIAVLLVGHFTMWTSHVSLFALRRFFLILLSLNLVIILLRIISKWMREWMESKTLTTPELSPSIVSTETPAPVAIIPQKIDGFFLLYKIVDRRLVSAAVALYVISAFSNIIGGGVAARKRNFPRIDSLNLVVLRRYNDSFICKMNKPNSDRLDAGFRIVGLDELKGQYISNQNFSGVPHLKEHFYGLAKKKP